MNEQAIRLAPLYKGWDVYQQHLIHALAPLSLDQLALRADPNLRSVDVIARHIIGARARWLYYVLREGDENLVSLGTWDDRDQPARSATELINGLKTSWQVVQNALQRWTISDLERPYKDEDETFTLQEIIWHLIEHDLHHGGEISFTLGMYGLPAIEL